jgi:predicted peptidase
MTLKALLGIFLTLTPLLAIVSACATRGNPVAPPDVREQTQQPGERRYTIAIPKSYTGDQPLPLILALHFAGHGTPFYGGLFLTGLVEPALRELQAIIVAPDCTAADWTRPQSEADVLALLDHVQNTYNVDPRRTLITGYSMGGMGTWHLAARHPDRFAAALIMAGAPQPDVLEVQWDIPLYVIHSRQDRVVPLQPTLDAVGQLQAQGVSVELALLDGVDHYDTGRFVAPLQQAIPWIEKAWQRQDASLAKV